MIYKILVIDDDQSVLDSLELLLESEGYHVKSINSPTLIADSLMDFTPNLILMDIRLGNEDGRLLCNEMKQNSFTEHIPIILVTGLSFNEISKIDCMADAILGKPYHMQNLLLTINTLL
ncbi:MULTISPECIES: response regulator [unclassified Pedobacter]|jgi:DNA-binding response OmpR family regulator|uniref:response regulator n=1 Tax=Pedobacter TaxID=84567 RepID=UPI000B4BBFC4|nr:MULTISPECIES: response regulator [unclassified Pedobacter]MCX2430765.1 response regulator [Pedobacter sp. GR22-10]MCX2584034.1 response regulator [Pedobacter sp. MR22-3]OWK69635.1 hypothetical protein CBW18_15950 [Pedobacter sp. AJM]